MFFTFPPLGSISLGVAEKGSNFVLLVMLLLEGRRYFYVHQSMELPRIRNDPDISDVELLEYLIGYGTGNLNNYHNLYQGNKKVEQEEQNSYPNSPIKSHPSNLYQPCRLAQLPSPSVTYHGNHQQSSERGLGMVNPSQEVPKGKCTRSVERDVVLERSMVERWEPGEILDEAANDNHGRVSSLSASIPPPAKSSSPGTSQIQVR